MMYNVGDQVMGDQEIELRKKYPPRERSFTCPFGTIEALEWGSPDAPKKIMCLHGWLDNAGSFDRLMPFFLDIEGTDKYHIVAVDMPGMGKSSHLPLGATYTSLSFIKEIRRVVLQLEWKKLILLSHSLGADFSFWYSCIYPEQVESMIAIDLAYPITRHPRNWNIGVANTIEDLLNCDPLLDKKKKPKPPIYMEYEAMQRLSLAHGSSLTDASAEILLKRGARNHDWGLTFTRDIRLRHMSLEVRFDDEQMLRYLKAPFDANLLVIRATETPYRRPEEAREKFYELFKTKCTLFRDVKLEGTHHLHMNRPAPVAQEIAQFLNDVEKDCVSSPSDESRATPASTPRDSDGSTDKQSDKESDKDSGVKVSSSATEPKETPNKTELKSNL